MLNEGIDQGQRCVFVSVCGVPNVGKSTLVNAVVGTKVVAVSHKAQTTRFASRGVLTRGDAQVIFIDSPGLFKPRESSFLEKKIAKNARETTRQGDVICLVIDAKKGLDKPAEEILQNAKEINKTAILVINKIDKVPQKRILELGGSIFASGLVKDVFYTSALSEKGIVPLTDYLLSIAPHSSWFYDKEMTSDMSTETFCSEITREKLFTLLREEVPYSIEVETKLKVNGDKIIVDQIVWTEEKRHKAIIIGNGGNVLQKVCKMAKVDIAKLFEGQEIGFSILVNHKNGLFKNI